MSRSSLRFILTFLMYLGVCIVLYPYLRGEVSTGMILLIAGFGLAVVCGLLRCYLTEGDSEHKHIVRPSP